MIERFRFWLRILGLVKLTELARFFLSPKGKLVAITLAGHNVWTRARSTDLIVAVESLGGEFDSLRHLLPRDFSGTIVDAGGYIGTAALALSELYPSAEILSVEPSSDNFELLTANCSSNERIFPVHAALIADSRTTVDLFDPGRREWGFTTQPQRKEAELIGEVRAVRLTDLCANKTSLGIIKIDIEGGEVDLFVREKAALDSFQAVFVELHERWSPGVEEAFFAFARDKIVVKGLGEKYLCFRRVSAGD